MTHAQVVRVAAFLRAINVGGRNVPMARLREVFEGVGCTNVKTVIASGNVVFEAPHNDLATLETMIEGAIHTALGWESETFLRTRVELQAVLAALPFPRSEIEVAGAWSVGFTRNAPPPEAIDRLSARETALDRFAVLGREVYWLCTVKQSESKVTNKMFEKALGMPSTFRGLSTVQRVLDQW